MEKPKFHLNPNEEIVKTIREGLKRTGGYCPCRLQHIPENICICSEFKQQLAAQGIPFDQYLKMTGTTEADFRKQSDGPAAEQVKMDLAVEAIIKAEGLEATDEDVENELKNVAEKYGMDLETVKKYLRPEDVKEQVIREKAVKVVADSAVAVAPAEEKAELEAEGEVVEKKPAKKPAAKKTAKKDAEKDAE